MLSLDQSYCLKFSIEQAMQITTPQPCYPFPTHVFLHAN